MNQENTKLLVDYLTELSETMTLLRINIGNRLLGKAVVSNPAVKRELAAIATHAATIAATSEPDRKYLAERVQDKATEIFELMDAVEASSAEEPAPQRAAKT